MKKRSVGRPTNRSRAGRPSKMTDEVLRKIEEVAALDGSVAEMALWANVHVDTIYAYMAENKAFSERIAKLRETPVLAARNRAVQGVKENYSNAMDYLKRKKKIEFGDNVDVTSAGQAISVNIVKYGDNPAV